MIYNYETRNLRFSEQFLYQFNSGSKNISFIFNLVLLLSNINHLINLYKFLYFAVVTGLCRDAVFSITAEYNSGTLRCFCDVEGSTDLECESFGGQCRCRPNVIGRTCSACRTGYYGFPNCQPCNCPSTAICNDYGKQLFMLWNYRVYAFKKYIIL